MKLLNLYVYKIKHKNWSNCKMTKSERSSITYREVLQRASSFLEKKGVPGFAAEWLLRERLNWTKTDLVKHDREKMPMHQCDQFEKDLNQLIKGQPMQQIIGHDWFFDRKFKVTSDTLIPRPETEEWLDRVLKQLPSSPLNILDIGTGTGVLAITTKLERPFDTVTAIDSSEAALAVDCENAKALKAEVTFKEGNLFEPVEVEVFVVILSNPPYISKNELNVMDQSVIDYEPKMALFAEEDGLAIYQELARSISGYIKPKGFIFLEIGYKQGPKVTEIFKEIFPEAKIDIWQDFSGLDRVVAISCV